MRRMIVRLQSFALVLLAGSAFAFGGGGPPDQGTLFSGQGLDWQRTATEAQPVAFLSVLPAAWPPQGSFTHNAANLKFLGCFAISNIWSLCVVEATLVAGHPESNLCGYPLSVSSPVQVLMHALSGTVDVTGRFDFTSTFLSF